MLKKALVMVFLAQASIASASQKLAVTNAALKPITLETKKVTLVNYWATWCAACKVELVEFNHFDKYKSKVDFWFISLDSDTAKPKAEFGGLAPNFSDSLYYDSKMSTPDVFDLTGFPATIIMDSKGKVLHKFMGYTKENASKIEDILKGS